MKMSYVQFTVCAQENPPLGGSIGNIVFIHICIILCIYNNINKIIIN